MTAHRWVVSTPVLEAGLVICWSSGFIGGTLAAATPSIFLVLFWRFVLATLCLVPLSMPQIRRLSMAQIGTQALIGSLAMFGYLATVISAIAQGVPPGTAALITSLQPLVTAAIAGLILGQSVSSRQWLGLVVGFSGVAVAVTGSLHQAPLWGSGLALLSMACLVVATLMAKSQSAPPALLPAITIQCAVSAVLFLPLALLQGSLTPEPVQAFLYAVGWLVILSTFGAYGLYWACLTRTSATRVSSLLYITPSITTIWAFVMFGDPMTLASVARLLIGLFGVYLASQR